MLDDILYVESGIMHREQLFVDIYGKRINVPQLADMYIHRIHNHSSFFINVVDYGLFYYEPTAAYIRQLLPITLSGQRHEYIAVVPCLANETSESEILYTHIFSKATDTSGNVQFMCMVIDIHGVILAQVGLGVSDTDLALISNIGANIQTTAIEVHCYPESTDNESTYNRYIIDPVNCNLLIYAIKYNPLTNSIVTNFGDPNGPMYFIHKNIDNPSLSLEFYQNLTNLYMKDGTTGSSDWYTYHRIVGKSRTVRYLKHVHTLNENKYTDLPSGLQFIVQISRTTMWRHSLYNGNIIEMFGKNPTDADMSEGRGAAWTIPGWGTLEGPPSYGSAKDLSEVYAMHVESDHSDKPILILTYPGNIRIIQADLTGTGQSNEINAIDDAPDTPIIIKEYAEYVDIIYSDSLYRWNRTTNSFTNIVQFKNPINTDELRKVDRINVTQTGVVEIFYGRSVKSVADVNIIPNIIDLQIINSRLARLEAIVNGKSE